MYCDILHKKLIQLHNAPKKLFGNKRNCRNELLNRTVNSFSNPGGANNNILYALIAFIKNVL